MMSVVEAVVRVVAGAASVPLFYVAWFVYEDEEAALQSRIEAWWLQFDDLRARMLTRHTAFVTVVAAHTRPPLDRMLGHKKISLRAWGVAFSLVMAWGFFGTALLFSYEPTGSQPPAFYVALGFLGLACAFAPAFSPRLVWLPVGVSVVIALLLIATLAVLTPMYNPRNTLKGTLVFLDQVGPGFAAFFAASALTLATLCLTRKSLLYAERSQSEWRAMPPLFAVFVPVLILFLGLFTSWAPHNLWHWENRMLQFAAEFTLLAVPVLLSAALFLSTASLMVLHRAAWPLLSRALYNVPRHRILENKKSMSAIAVTLFAIALGGGQLKHVLAFLGA